MGVRRGPTLTLPPPQANTLEALDETMKEGMSSGAKIDLALHKLRVALFHRDLPLARARVEEVKESVL